MRINSKCSQGLKKKRRVIPLQSNISKDCSKLNSNANNQVRDEANNSKNSSDSRSEYQIQQKHQYQAHLDISEKQKMNTQLTVARQSKLMVKNSSKQAMLSGLQEYIQKARSCEQKFNNYKQLISKYEEYRKKSTMIECKSSNIRGLNHYRSQQQISQYYPSIEEMLHQKQHLKYNDKKMKHYSNSNNNINKNYNSLSSKTLVVKRNQGDRLFQMKNNQHLKNNITKINYHQVEEQPYAIMINQNNISKMQERFDQKEITEMNQIKNTNRKGEIDVNNKNLSEVRNELNGNNLIFIDKNYSSTNKNHQHQNKNYQHQNKSHQHQNTSHQRQSTNSQHSNNSYQHTNKQQFLSINNTNPQINQQQPPTNTYIHTNDSNIINNHKQQAYTKQLHQKYLSLNENYNKHLKQTKQLNDKFDREKQYLLKIKTQHFQNQQLIDQLMYMIRNRDYQLLQSGGDGCQGLSNQNMEVQTQQLSGQSYQEDNRVIEVFNNNNNKQHQANNKSIPNIMIANNALYQRPNSQQPLPNTPFYPPSPLMQNTTSIGELKNDLFDMKKLIIGQKSLSKYRFQPSMII